MATKKSWIQKYGGALFLAVGLCVALTVFLVYSAHHKNTHNSASSAPTPSVSASLTPSLTTSPSGSVTSSASVSPTVTSPPITVDVTLVSELQQFASSYYFIQPDDTAVTRAARQPAFVMAPIDYRITMDAALDKARLTQLLTIRGSLLPSSVVGTPNPQDATQLSVTAHVLTAFYRVDGTLASGFGDTKISTVWQKAAGQTQWTLIRFVEGGDTG